MRALELWGGVECTMNRVGALYFDQTKRTGHHERDSDLDLFAAYGLKTLRYPLLWERCCERPGVFDWTWTDARLTRMQTLGMRPIAGLLHHGSGPVFTDLLDDVFPEKFAVFARAAARRYPWIKDWTPINEPMTTAPFSGLYAHWYPHRRDERSFWKMMLNQMDATRLAMRAIHAEIADARLIQTEDMGFTYATRAASGQAEYDNHRRWMTFDLLSGRVSRGHPLHQRLKQFGFGKRLGAIADDPCLPNVMGINHYLTSDRFLDHRLENYAACLRGGNGFISYADVETARVLQPAPDGLGRALRETWARYDRPIAVTEVHNGCSRDEQMRWFFQAWQTALAVRAEGIPIEAVTSWALLGGYDWDSLLTRAQGHYETGAFDVRSGTPRPTALAAHLKAIQQGATPALPVGMRTEGWWARDIRLHHSPSDAL